MNLCITKAIVVLAVLACVEFYPFDKLPPRILWNYKLVTVPGDGRCMFSSVWLGTVATQKQQVGWYLRKRNQCGFCMDSVDAKREETMVMDWASNLPDMPQKTRARLQCGESSTHEDLVTCF